MHRWAIVVLVVFCASAYARVAAPPAGSRIPVDGTAKWLLGGNYPWSNYGRDFGTNNWGYAGFATQSQSGNFKKLQNAHARLVRVWLFADGRAGIDLDSQGYPGSVQAKVYDDMNALINDAKAANLRLVMVLFDFHLGFYSSSNNGVQMGGRNSWINYAPHVNALMTKVLPPLFAKYGNNPVIHSWEVMNEPEWLIWDLPQNAYDSGKANGCSQAEFHTFAAGICNLVHTKTNQYCTLGSASLKWARVWTDAYATKKGFAPIHLDYYQCHYYSWMDGQTINNDPDLGTVKMSPIDQKYADLGLDRPMVVGEFYSTRDSVSNQLTTYLNNGYAGAWPWSVNSDYAFPFSDFTSWGQAHSSVISMPFVAPGPTVPHMDDETATAEQAVAASAPEDNTLSGGQIAGIVVGSIGAAAIFVAAIGMIVAAVVVVVIKRRRANKEEVVGGSNYIRMTDTNEAEQAI